MANPIGRPPVNRFKVAPRHWKAWGREGQRVFNKTYEYVRKNQTTMIHPKATVVSREQWDAVAWNAAWIAATYAAGRKPAAK